MYTTNNLLKIFGKKCFTINKDGIIFGNMNIVISKKTLRLIKENKINYHSVLTVSPYSNKQNMNNIFDKELFYELLFNELGYYKKMAQVLNNLTIGGDTYKPIIFLYGFKGTGKTTFINWFFDKYIDDKLDFLLKYVDLGRRYLLDDEKKPIAVRYLEKIMKEYRKSRTIFTDYLNWFIPHLKDMNRSFSRNFRRLFESLDLCADITCQNDYYNDLEDILRQIDETDIIVFYMLYQIKKNKRSHYIFVLDNLDIIELEYFSETMAQDVLSIDDKITSLLQNKLIFDSDLVPNYNLIFILRDANSALVNAHFRNRDQLRVKTIGFNISYGVNNIFDRRFELADYLIRKDIIKSQTHKILGQIKEDNYSQKVFLQLFNFDHREYINFLVYISELSINAEFNNIKVLNEYSHILKTDMSQLQNISKFGARGIIFYFLVNYLMRDQYLETIDKISFRQKIRVGYFNPLRLILTVILNHNKFEISKERIIDDDYKINYFYKSSSILDIVNMTKDLYPIEVILDVIESYFLCFKKSWSHLVTIHGLSIRKKGQLVKELKPKIDQFNESPTQELTKYLNSVRVKINPSGYIYLQYIITHFEFFSKRSHNSRPLFLATDYDKIKKRYQFESIIDSVYNKVSKCIIEMRDFYNQTFINKMGFDDDSYLFSDYSFKYVKNQYMDGTAQYIDMDDYLEHKHATKGQFYSIRIIEHHISYLDSFRISLLNSPKIISKFKSSNEDLDLVDINRKLVKKISKYNELYKKSGMVNKSERYYQVFKNCIENIEKSEFRDFSLLISNQNRVLK